MRSRLSDSTAREIVKLGPKWAVNFSSCPHSLSMFYAALNLPQKKRGWSHLLLAPYFWYRDFWLLLFCRIIMVPSDIFRICFTECFWFYHISFLSAPHPLFLSYRFYYLHVFFCTCFLQLYHKSPSPHLWLRLLIIYLSLSILQSNSGISMLQISHMVLLVLLL